MDKRVCTKCGTTITFDGKKMEVMTPVNKAICRDCIEYMKGLKVKS